MRRLSTDRPAPFCSTPHHRREQKDARKEKKLAFKKNYGTIADSVVLWEELRLKTTTKEAKAALVDQIVAKVCVLLWWWWWWVCAGW